MKQLTSILLAVVKILYTFSLFVSFLYTWYISYTLLIFNFFSKNDTLNIPLAPMVLIIGLSVLKSIITIVFRKNIKFFGFIKTTIFVDLVSGTTVAIFSFILALYAIISGELYLSLSIPLLICVFIVLCFGSVFSAKSIFKKQKKDTQNAHSLKPLTTQKSKIFSSIIIYSINLAFIILIQNCFITYELSHNLYTIILALIISLINTFIMVLSVNQKWLSKTNLLILSIIDLLVVFSAFAVLLIIYPEMLTVYTLFAVTSLLGAAVGLVTTFVKQ